MDAAASHPPGQTGMHCPVTRSDQRGRSRSESLVLCIKGGSTLPLSPQAAAQEHGVHLNRHACSVQTLAALIEVAGQF